MSALMKALARAEHRHAQLEHLGFPAVIADGVAPHLVSLIARTSFEAEQYRTLRHIVEQAHGASRLRVFAVSAPATGDGKTTTAINLAGALAQAPDAKVLVVDADFRQPNVGAALGLGRAQMPGLAEATLDPKVNLENVVLVLPAFNLSVLTAGRAPTSPYELLQSARLTAVFDQLRREYDYVIVDTPPLVALPDCRLLARQVDTFVVVVTAHKTPRRLLEAALGVVDPAKVLGLVFNGDDDAPAARYPRGRQRYGVRAEPRTRASVWSLPRLVGRLRSHPETPRT